jgi:pimeloyl-ACP methyl ester carboxylesterase
MIQCLKDDFRVIMFEIPGFGFSLPRSGFRFDFTKVNDLVAEFLRRLALGPYLLAFPCVSAYGAIDIAARFPSLVSGVVLVQAPSWSEEVKWKHGRDRQGILSKPVIGQLALQALKRKQAPQWFDAAVGNREKLSEFVETTDVAFSHGACFCLASAFQRYLTDTEQPLSIVNQPSLARASRVPVIFPSWKSPEGSHERYENGLTHERIVPKINLDRSACRKTMMLLVPVQVC